MKELLKSSCKEIGIDIDDKKINQFIKYKELLLDWNKKINLTAITEEKEIVLKHFIDSISILKYIELENKNVIDVGTGAGFPGIPVKIMCSSIELTLMDSLKKRISFLETICKELDINDVNCVHMRAEDGGRNIIYREQFDFCISRAVADLSVLLEYCMPFIKIGGEFISLKGPNIKEEIIKSEFAIKELGGEILSINYINIPFTDIKHSIIKIKKIRQLSNRYPRKAGKITKSPIEK